MNDPSNQVSVFLDDPALLASSLQTIARVTAAVLGEPLSDAAQRVRYGGGIVVRNVWPPHAREITRGLAAHGLSSFTVDRPAFRQPPRPRRPGHFAVTAEGIELAPRLTPGRIQRLPWARIQAVHAHASIVTGAADQEGPARRGGDLSLLSEAARQLVFQIRDYEDRERVRIQLGLDVFVAGATPSAQELHRLASDDPGIYGWLPRRSDHTLENYLELVRRLVEAAPAGVLVPHTTRRFVARGAFTEMLFTKPEELDAFNTWIIHAVAEGITLGDDPEDVSDDDLEDPETAVVLSPDDEAGDDVDELDDEELDDDEDGDEEPDEDEEPDDEDEDHPEGLVHSAEELDALARGPADEDVKAALALMDQTTRLDAAAVQAVLSDVETLEDVDDDEVEPDAEVSEQMRFFEPNSGRWAVGDLLEGADAIEDGDLEGATGARGSE